ncbi:MAG TPA: SDR family NAD(P)-dependent oxidoreductase [Thermodesulfobacteriota bacterium]|nr:SDR family NAD(P)-dependent oxidoreductase [Thermodesulfobacteriota bacterium]
MQHYWENILNKVSAVREVPKDRWDPEMYYDTDRRKKDSCYSKWGAFLDDLPFDPTLFGMPPNSVRSIEPLQLMVLEIARRALADAGYARRPFPRETTSVILGLSGTGELSQRYGIRTSLPTLFGSKAADIISHFGEYLPEWTEDTFPGFLLNVAAGRVANRLDLGGLNCSVDAACASSLAAVYLAVKDLEARTSDMVIVGGADCNQNPFSFMSFSKTQALSPRGECNALDECADGIVLGEGVAVMVLKRLADAERDGDRIYAVIKGFAAASDGREKSLTAPARNGQTRALQRAYTKAGCSPATVELIEAHATGTAAGDRTEIESLIQVLNEAGVTEPSCALGSVKCNIGHTKAAAGMASLMKAVLAVYYRVLPPHIGVQNPNPALCEPGSPLYVNRDARPWVRHAPDVPRRAGVNAFGFGGTNYHAVLEEYDRDPICGPKPGAIQQWPSELLIWKGRSRAEMLDQLSTWETVLAQGAELRLGDLASSAYSRSRERTGTEKEPLLTLAIVASTVTDLQQKLEKARSALNRGEGTILDLSGIYFSEHPTASEGALAFLFSGQGAQYVNMAADLSLYFPSIRSLFDRSDWVLAGKYPKPFSTYLFPPSSFTKEGEKAQLNALSQTHVAQPAIGTVSLGLLSLLSSMGIKPDMVGGHSYGEFVALCCAGVFSEENLIRISEARGRFMTEAAGTEPGTMAAVNAGAETIRGLLNGREGVWIANINAPDQTVITGNRAAVEEMIEVCKEQGMKARPLVVSCAMHSPVIAPAAERLSEFLSHIPIKEPVVKVFSNTTGKAYPHDPEAVVSQLAQHLVNQVKFVQEIETMYAEGARIFIEIGPGRILSGLVSQILDTRPHRTIFTNQPGQPGLERLLHALAELISQGVPVSLDPLFAGRALTATEPALLVKESRKAEPKSTLWLVSGVRSVPVQEAENRQPGKAIAPFALAGQVSSGMKRPLPGAQEAESGSMSRLHGKAPDPASLKPDSDYAAQLDESNNHISNANREDSAGVSLQGGTDMDEAMLHYQQLMARFLDTQKSVMLAYLEGRGRTDGVISIEHGTRIPDIRPGSEHGRSAPGARRIQTPPANATISPVILDDGMSASLSGVNAGSGSVRIISRQELQERLLAIASDQTGYPVEMLNLDLDMEAELGIDSIKRVEILSAFALSFTDEERSKLEPFLDDLSRLKDLASIVEHTGQALLLHRAIGETERASERLAEALPASTISMEELQERLLAIASDQTGYPVEMLNLDLDMEAELGIDSIKRVEILSAFALSFTDEERSKLEPFLDDLSRLKDLRTLLQKTDEVLSGKILPEEKQPMLLPPVQAAQIAATGEENSFVVRSVLTPVPYQLYESDPALCNGKGTLVITDDGRGIASALSEQLKQRGCSAVTLRFGSQKARENGSYTTDLTDFAAVEELVQDLRKNHSRIEGVIHLLPLGTGSGLDTMDLAVWKKLLAADVKSFYYLTKQLSPDIRKSALEGTGWLIAATLQNGHDSSGRPRPQYAGHAGLAGFLKTVAQEWPEVRCRSITVDPAADPGLVADQILAEMNAADGVVEVAYRGEHRMVFQARQSRLRSNGNKPLEPQKDWVILVTGGAVGITAEVTHELAERYQPILLLAGRSPLPEPEPPDTAQLTDLQEIKAALIERLQSQEKNLTPARVEAALSRLMKDRQITAHIEAMRKTGSQVRYYQVDVRDEASFGSLIDSIYQSFGRLDGVIHGAGIIEDKLLDDKTPDSFDRVFDTKADSAFILADKVRLDDLKFIVFFTSVAGAFGNIGQADYAAANEVVNSLALALNRRIQGRVLAINWNPWADTGMVSKGKLEKMFQERGVQLIPTLAGRRFLDEELRNGTKEEVVIVAGGGPWVK